MCSNQTSQIRGTFYDISCKVRAILGADESHNVDWRTQEDIYSNMAKMLDDKKVTLTHERGL